MLFNSVDFLIFFPVVVALHFVLRHRHRWLLLLVASCVFYMSFVPAYILILLATISVDYFAAIYLDRAQGARRRWILISAVVLNFGVLFAFKYFNFFNANLWTLSQWIGFSYSRITFEVILPIGLSFHTFQSVSYLIDVHRGTQPVERHPGMLALYVMFFPQLVAGPIERAENLLPQFRTEQHFDFERAALFERHRVSGQAVEDMQPYGRQTRPTIEIDFAKSGASYRLLKAFGQRPEAQLIGDGKQCQGDAADEEGHPHERDRRRPHG